LIEKRVGTWESGLFIPAPAASLSESLSYAPLTDDALVATFKGACDVEDPLNRKNRRRDSAAVASPRLSLQLPCPETPTAFNISQAKEQVTFPIK
jgi:hypothetical protein